MKQILLLSAVLFSLHCFANPGGGDPPVADYSYYIEFIGVGSEVSFLNESIDGETYFWDFGDGGTSTDLNPVHAYAEPGLFIVCLTTTNDFGVDSFCDTLNTYYAPSADFSFIGDPTVTFTDLTTNFPTTWDWFFGDGGTSSEQNPVHTFLENGAYSVCLSAGNPGGTNYLCKLVAISSYEPPVASFEFAGDPLVTFTDLSTLSPYEWYWDFDDGDTSILQNPAHLFLTNGIFHVCLTAANGGGSNTVCEDVTIAFAVPPPVVEFTYLINGLECAFVDISLNDPVEWYWDFGDGNNSTEQNPVHVYEEAGVHTACLTASNEGGENTTCKNLFFETGISENNLNQIPIRISPNPASEYLFIQSDAQINFAQISIYDIAGRELKTFSDISKILISDLAAGNYLLKCITVNGEVVVNEFCVTK